VHNSRAFVLVLLFALGESLCPVVKGAWEIWLVLLKVSLSVPLGACLGIGSCKIGLLLNTTKFCWLSVFGPIKVEVLMCVDRIVKGGQHYIGPPDTFLVGELFVSLYW
jgi:hypothetical protein